MTHTFTLSIDCDNAAFDGIIGRRAEVARILRAVARSLEAGVEGRPILDVNGNRVGEFELAARAIARKAGA